MNVIQTVLMFIWSLRIAAMILTYIQLWYVKEYRFDRMLIHLKSPMGKWIYISKFRLPPQRPKTFFLFISTLVALFVIYGVLPFSFVGNMVLIDISTFPLVSFFVWITKIPTAVYHRILIVAAVRKMRSHTPMIVIGITGSYGKTSTKEFLATIIGTKYRTIKTEASRNSPVGIAELVLKHLKPDHEVFVVEMGAYKQGEIASMCAMVRPTIAIVTAINAQHQDLFGSIETTVNAKYELIAGLSSNGVAIVNTDNSYVRSMGRRAVKDGIRVVEYSLRGHTVEETKSGIKLDGTPIGVFGVHQASNILAAVEAAKVAGLTQGEIQAGMRMLQPFAHTMQPFPGINGALFVDDTFNNNPDAAIAAIRYLSTKKGKKILVFQPMIELGAYARESHENVAQLAVSVCDKIYLTNASFEKAFGGRATVLSPKETAAAILRETGKGDTVLFKGKEAARVLQLLI